VAYGHEISISISLPSIRPPVKKNILITGPPGVGKTSAIVSIVKTLRDGVGGFYTDEIREGGERKGFGISSLDGENGVLAHVNLEGHHKVGKYVVNVPDLDEVGVSAIRRAIKHGKIVVADEIGRMELFSPAFRSAIVEALDSRCPVAATIMSKEEPFCDLIKRRADVQIVLMTKGNRDRIPEEVVDLLRKYLCSCTQ